MPVNAVKTAAQERLWKKAKARAAAQGHALDYAYVMGIYQRMLGEPVEKSMMGAPQFAGWQIPGQVPRGFRDEQVELARQQAQDALRLATTPPTQAAAERASARPMLTPQSVVKDLGLDLAVGQRLSRLVDGLTTGQGDELKFRQAWMACLVDGEPGLDPVARQQLGERGLALWRSRAGQRETPMAGELRITVPRERKLEKAMLFIGPRGGRWADAAHTIPWDDKVHGKPKVVIHDKTEDPEEQVEPAPRAESQLTPEERAALESLQAGPVKHPSPAVKVTLGKLFARGLVSLGDAGFALTPAGAQAVKPAKAAPAPPALTVPAGPAKAGPGKLFTEQGARDRAKKAQLGLFSSATTEKVQEARERAQQVAKKAAEAGEPVPQAALDMQEQALAELKDREVDAQAAKVARQVRGPESKRSPVEIKAEAGEHVWGSRKDLAALVHSADDLAKLTPEEQSKLVTKARLVEPWEAEDLLAEGWEPQAVLARHAIEACIAPAAGDSLEARQAYMNGVDYWAHTFDACRTFQDVQEALVDLNRLTDGRVELASMEKPELDTLLWKYAEHEAQRAGKTLAPREQIQALSTAYDAASSIYRDLHNTVQAQINEYKRQFWTEYTHEKRNPSSADFWERWVVKKPLPPELVAGQEKVAALEAAKKRAYQALQDAGGDLIMRADESAAVAWANGLPSGDVSGMHIRAADGSYSMKFYKRDAKLAEAGWKVGGNQYQQMVAALGERMVRLVNSGQGGGGGWSSFQEKATPKAWLDVLATVKAMRKPKEKGGPAPTAEDHVQMMHEHLKSKKRGGGKGGPGWLRDVPDTVVRKGGRELGKSTPAEIAREFGLKNVQFGNWVSEEDAKVHVPAAHAAFADLQDLLGADSPGQVSMNGRLSLGIGARGSGNARAHYETQGEIINLTKISGGGALAHEWAHALDNLLSKAGNPESTQAHRFVSDGQDKGVDPVVAKAFHSAVQEILQGEFYQDAKAMGSAYWRRPHEMFARAFEAWAEDELARRGQENSYLVAGTRKVYQTRKFASQADAAKGRSAQPYPQGAKRAAIGEKIGALVAALRETGALKKALESLDARERGPRLTVPAGELQKAGGPFIGPKGGKWADAQHTISWDPQVHGKGAGQGDLFGKKPEPKLGVPAEKPETTEKPVEPVDSSFYGVRRKFGVAGGPDEHYLTDAGLEVTAKVGGGVSRAAEEALRALPQDGQPMLVEEEFVGERRGRTAPMLRRTPWGAAHGELGSALSHHGLIELSPIPERREKAYRITEKGKQTLQAIEAERARLLGRIARAHPLENVGAQPESAVTVPADQPAPLPARTLDTMSDAIALGSPSGRQSQASQQAAQARLGEALFGPGGLKAPQQAQPSTQEVLRRQAKGLRDLAARGVGPRKHLKEAERLEGMAEELEAVAAGPGTEKFDRAVIRAEREFREWVGASGSGSEKRGDELAKQLQQAPVQEWPKLAHQARDAYEQALLHWDAAAAWKADPNHASSRVLLGLFRVRNAKGRTPPKAESSDILWHMTPAEVERLQGAAQTHMARVRAKIDQVIARTTAVPEVDQAEDHARRAVESKHVAERMAIRDKYKGREVMKQIGGETWTVPHPEEEQQLAALEPQQAAEHREALAPGSYLRKRGENARPAELAQLAEQSASHFRRAAEWLEKQEKPSAVRVRALAEKFEKLAAEHRGSVGVKKYRYAVPLRPISYANVPKGWVAKEEHPKFRHGVAVYDRPLTPEEIKSYELEPILEPHEIQARIQQVAQHLGEYAQEHLEEAVEDPDYFNMSVQQAWARTGPGYTTVEDFKQVEQGVLAELKRLAPAKKSLALLVPLDRLEKGAPRGGKYVKRAPRPGGQGYRYYYSEKGYERATGHVDGQRAADQHLGKRVATLLNKAGPAGLHPRRLAELVRQHGRQRVAGVLKATGCRFDKGRFYPKTRGGRC